MSKAMLDDFKRKYPNAPLGENGTPGICPHDLGFAEIDCNNCGGHTCKDCWNRPTQKKRKYKIRKGSPLDWALCILAAAGLIVALSLPATIATVIGG